MNRRHLLMAGSAMLLGACSWRVQPDMKGGAIQTEIVLFKDAQAPLRGKSVIDWTWPGVALTANTSRFSADYLKGVRLLRASWVLVWNPQYHNIAMPNKPAVRLVSFDNGPANIAEIAAVTISAGVVFNSPRVDVRNVTEVFNGVLNGGISKQVGHQTMGDGVDGCLIYGSWIEFVWG